MPEPISALDLTPYDLIREVSPEAVNFYVEDLSGLYLPEEFQNEHADVTDVKYWRARERLRGKFGRFTVMQFEESGEEEREDQLDGILVMGTTSACLALIEVA